MKNINRDHLVVVNAKTAEIIDAPKYMSFYVTDEYTCNIFFQLIINDTNSSIIGAPIEDASDYTLTLRVLKPNNQHKDIVATPIDKSKNFFVADLDPEFTDYIGICKCELLIETMINGRKEISTSSPFEYEVIESIFSSLDTIIKGEPNSPLLIDTLATKDYVAEALENIELIDYATKNYVNEAMADINLTSYATKDYVNQAIVGGGVDLDGYITNQELADALANFSISDPYDDSELRGLIANKANKNHTHSEYATTESVNTSLNNKADKDHVHDNIWIGTQDEYDAITSINPNVLYFIQEDEV